MFHSTEIYDFSMYWNYSNWYTCKMKNANHGRTQDTDFKYNRTLWTKTNLSAIPKVNVASFHVCNHAHFQNCIIAKLVVKSVKLVFFCSVLTQILFTWINFTFTLYIMNPFCVIYLSLFWYIRYYNKLYSCRLILSI